MFELNLLTAFICFIAYLVGSIPFGLILTRLAGLGDLRSIGSGNIGATNVMRTGNKKLAIATLLLDAFKGWFAVALAPNLYFLIGPHLMPGLNTIPVHVVYGAGLAALIGHIFPIWLKFKGGKGVATYFGVLLAISWVVFLITAINWLVVFKAKRISSLSALIAFFFAPFWLWAFVNPVAAVFGGIASALVFYTHRANITRLRKGEEQPFAKKKG